MTHTNFRFNRECPCYGCMLVPICRNKFNDQLLGDCALIRGLLTTIYENIEYDEDNITNITVVLVPIDMTIELHITALFYWSSYPKWEYKS